MPRTVRQCAGVDVPFDRADVGGRGAGIRNRTHGAAAEHERAGRVEHRADVRPETAELGATGSIGFRVVAEIRAIGATIDGAGDGSGYTRNRRRGDRSQTVDRQCRAARTDGALGRCRAFCRAAASIALGRGLSEGATVCLGHCGRRGRSQCGGAALGAAGRIGVGMRLACTGGSIGCHRRCRRAAGPTRRARAAIAADSGTSCVGCADAGRCRSSFSDRPLATRAAGTTGGAAAVAALGVGTSIDRTVAVEGECIRCRPAECPSDATAAAGTAVCVGRAVEAAGVDRGVGQAGRGCTADAGGGAGATAACAACGLLKKADRYRQSWSRSPDWSA